MKAAESNGTERCVYLKATVSMERSLKGSPAGTAESVRLIAWLDFRTTNSGRRALLGAVSDVLLIAY